MTDYCPGAVQSPQPGGVTLDTSLPRRFVWHITDDALDANGHQPEMGAVDNYLVGKEWCPHITWNPFTGEMIQFYPASVGSRALMFNDQDGAVCVQVEIFFTPGCVVDGVTYASVADTPLKGFDTLLAWADSLGVPRVWPMGAPQWTGNARDVGIWNTQAGHYGHCNSPGDTHVDPGPMPSLDRGITVQGSTITQEDALTPELAARLNEIVAWCDGKFKALEGQAENNRNLLAGYVRDNVPASVLNQPFKLADGTTTNLAGILTAIHAQPTAAAGPTAAVDPQAVVHALRDQLNK